MKNVAYDPKATSYAALALQMKSSGAQAVFIGGLICENGGKLIKDIRANAPKSWRIPRSGRLHRRSRRTSSSPAGKAEGMYVSVAGLPNDQLPAGGQKFVKDFTAANGGTAPDPYAVYAAQAADVMLAAIAGSDGTRAGVTSSLFKVNIKGSILGNVSFNPNGDVTSNPVTIYIVAHGKGSVHKVIVPALSLVSAA